MPAKSKSQQEAAGMGSGGKARGDTRQQAKRCRFTDV